MSLSNGANVIASASALAFRPHIGEELVIPTSPKAPSLFGWASNLTCNGRGASTLHTILRSRLLYGLGLKSGNTIRPQSRGASPIKPLLVPTIGSYWRVIRERLTSWLPHDKIEAQSEF